MDHLRRCIFIFLLLMLSLSSEAPAAARLEPLTIAYSTFSGAYLPLWVAVEEQLGRKHGLDIKSVYAGRIRPQQLLASGEASRMTNPATWGARDSASPGATP